MSRMPEKINEPLARVHLGIDVGKSRLDVFVHPVGAKLRVTNDKTGIDRIVKLSEGFDVQLARIMHQAGRRHVLDGGRA